MDVFELISKIKKQGIQATVKVDIGEVDIQALNTLLFLYDELDEKATYADAERVLTEAVWWHVTLNTLMGEEGGNLSNSPKKPGQATNFNAMTEAG